MLDAILDQPMDQAIAGLQLPPGVRDALLGGTRAMRSILDAVIAHEQGEWDRSAQIAEEVGLRHQWSRRLCRGAALDPDVSAGSAAAA